MIFRLESWHINRGQVELALIYPRWRTGKKEFANIMKSPFISAIQLIQYLITTANRKSHGTNIVVVNNQWGTAILLLSCDWMLTKITSIPRNFLWVVLITNQSQCQAQVATPTEHEVALLKQFTCLTRWNKSNLLQERISYTYYNIM